MIVPQLIELNISFEALERGMAGELLEPCDAHALRGAARGRRHGAPRTELFTISLVLNSIVRADRGQLVRLEAGQ